MIKQFAKLGLILAAFAVTACVGLAFVYAATETQIAANQSKQLNESLKDIFKDADSFKDIAAELPALANGFRLEGAYGVSRSGTIVGVAIKASGSSYGGPVSVLIGLNAEKRIAGVRVLSSSDTPGLGLNAMNKSYFVNKVKKLTFQDQFRDKSTNDPFIVKQDVDAITASTISSKAITGIIKAAVDSGQAWIEQKALGGK